MSETTDWLEDCYGVHNDWVKCAECGTMHCDDEWGCPCCESASEIMEQEQ